MITVRVTKPKISSVVNFSKRSGLTQCIDKINNQQVLILKRRITAMLTVPFVQLHLQTITLGEKLHAPHSFWT